MQLLDFPVIPPQGVAALARLHRMDPVQERKPTLRVECARYSRRRPAIQARAGIIANSLCARCAKRDDPANCGGPTRTKTCATYPGSALSSRQTPGRSQDSRSSRSAAIRMVFAAHASWTSTTPGIVFMAPAIWGDRRKRPGSFTSTSRAPPSTSTTMLTSPSPRSPR